ncbi:MAG: glycosyltransferase family 4 protein [Arthrobacter sp.]
MRQFVRNLRLTCGTIRQHLADDPVVLLLQTSRRFPTALLPAARSLLRWAPRNAHSALLLFAALAAGEEADLARRLQVAAAGDSTGEQARRLADIALAAGRQELADELLAKAGSAKRLNSTTARRLWFDGALSEAVDTLTGPTRSEQLQRRRLSAEVAILHNASPRLDKQPYSPVPGRILHLLTNSLPHTASGYAQRSHSTLLAQQEAGLEVLAVTRLGYPVQVGKLLARGVDVVDGVTYRRLLPSKMAPTMDARLQQQAEELMAEALKFRPSVLQTTTHFVNGLVVRAVAQALGIPWVYEVRGQLADTWASTRGVVALNSEKYTLFRNREIEVMQDADLVVTLGQAMKDNITATGVPAAKVLLAPNAIGGDFLSAPASAPAARRELGLPEHQRCVGTVSSLVPYEGVDDLIGAFELLAEDLPDLRLLVVGDGVALPALKVQAGRSRHADRIIFTGRVPRNLAIRYHQALDVFVVPRKDLDVTRSVTPLKPVEAMACAKPVVASRLPALAEIVEHEVTGLLTAPGNRDELADALRILLDDSQLADAFGQSGRIRVLKERTWSANAAALIAELETLGVTIR